MRHQEFLAGVSTRGGYAGSDDARTAADAVLATLAERMSADDRAALAAALPTLLEQESGVDDPADARSAGGDSAADLVAAIARRTGWDEGRARYALTAVTGQLTAEDPDLGARIGRVVPADAQGGGPTLPPDAASEAQQGRPQPVDAEELERALAGLVGWTGDVSGIVRTVELPTERLDLVLERVRRAEHELSHRTHVVDRTASSLTLRARTESLHAVTRLDLDLAREVDAAVDAVGSGG